MSVAQQGISNRGWLRPCLEAAVGIVGLLLLAAALAANQDWWDRHFLPLYFYPREKFLLEETLARCAAALAGMALLVWGRPAGGRFAESMPPARIAGALLRILLAVGLSLALIEGIKGHAFRYAAAEVQPGEEPMRQPDQRLGWVYAPSHDGSAMVGGRRVAYSTDSLGYRVAHRGTPVDLNLPSLIFTGESIISGYGLNWEETIPAQVGSALKLQSASIAVFGYGNDQAFLRLQSELPRFQHPVAVISLFVPSLLARNMGDDRPHLGPGLIWKPATHRLWLSALFRFLLPYHSEREIEQGIAATREQLVATAALARSRGAVALVVDPQYGSETQVERTLRRRILEDSGVAFLLVKLDPAWHLQGDLHPDARAAQAIAQAIAARLKSEIGPSHSASPPVENGLAGR